MGEFEYSLLALQDADITLRVLGTAGEIEADLERGTLRRRDEGKVWREEVYECSQPVYGFSGMRETIGCFVRAAKEGRAGSEMLEACRRVHEGVLMCVEGEGE